MYTVFFHNFGFTKHFDSKDSAIKYAVESGFVCFVIDEHGNPIKHVKVI